MTSLVSAQSGKIQFTEYKLDNGLTVILHQDKSVPIVAVSVMYHVGSKNERPDRTGFAHFFEHLLFEGTKNIPRGDYFKLVQSAGGTLNANTWYDRTYYYEIMPSNQLELGLWMESERMLHANVDETGINTQRNVIKEERSQTVDNRPYGRVLEESMQRAFTVHPYRWSVIGDMAHLDAADENDFINFYKTYYVPNNAILSIAGSIDIEEAKALVQKYFGTIPRGADVVKPDIVEPPLRNEVRDTFFDNIQLPAVVQTYRIPAMGTPDYYAVDMLSKLLSGGKSSRMYKSIVDEQQLALQVMNIPIALEHPGVSINFGLVNMGVSPEKLEEAMNREIENVRTNLISDEEFQKLRNQVENEFYSSSSTMAGIAENLANYKMYYGDANLINTEIERYMRVTKEDLQMAALKYYSPVNRVTLYYLPKPQQP
jgi:predicted Zn-dependent peptidase